MVPFASAELITPSIGLMIWTLVTFTFVLVMLKKFAFGPIAEAIEHRRQVVRESLEASDQAREEAKQMLTDYRKQLAEARHEAGALVEAARRSGEEEARGLRQEIAAQRE